MVTATLLAFLVIVAPAVGQLSSYWGFRFGTTTVTQDNSPSYTDSRDSRFGWVVGVSKTLPIHIWKSTRIVMEVQARQSIWNRYFRGGYGTTQLTFNDPHVSIREFVFAPLFVHGATERARMFLQVGPEIAWVGAVSGTHSYDEANWSKIVFGINMGGGFIFPVSNNKEFVIDVRYNSDISEAIDDSKREAPVGSRFDEIHILLGVNFGTYEGY